MNLKHELTAYYIKHEAENGKEETFNVLELLSKYNDDLDGLYPYDSMLLLRLIDEPNLYLQVESVTIQVPKEYNPFKPKK